MSLLPDLSKRQSMLLTSDSAEEEHPTQSTISRIFIQRYLRSRSLWTEQMLKGLVGSAAVNPLQMHHFIRNLSILIKDRWRAERGCVSLA